MAFINNKNKKDKPKVNVGLNSEIVDLMISYSLSDSPLVNLKSIINLKNLLDRIEYDDELYQNRLKFDILKTILSSQVDKSIFNYGLIKIECNNAFPEEKEFIETIMDEAVAIPTNESDIEYINEFVQKRLTYMYLFENRQSLSKSLQALDVSDDIEEVNDMFEKVVGRLYKDIQNSKAVRKDSASDFCIGGGDGNFKNKNLKIMTKKTIDDLRKPSNHIKTGIKAFNRMLGGGLENGRAYLVYAPPKSFKSGLMMNIGIWACRENEFKPKDPEKTPCVLMVTMENTSNETIKRMFQHITGENIKDYDFEEAMKIIDDYVVGDRNVSFEIRYRKNKSISTADLDSMIDELALEGKEVVLLIQDYTKRIRSTANLPELRLELGEVTNDLVSISRDREIPVLSAAQINRVGISKIEAALLTNKGNLGKLIDKSDAGESTLPLENIDYAFSITPESDPSTGENYLGFKLWVSRVETDGPKFFLQRFENGMKLEEDLHSDSSTSLESLDVTDTHKNFNPNMIKENKWRDANGKVKPPVKEVIEEEVF